MLPGLCHNSLRLPRCGCFLLGRAVLIITSALRPRVGKLYCEWSESKYFRLCRSSAGRFSVLFAVGDCLAVLSARFVFYNLMLMCYALKIVCSLQSLLQA